MGGSNASYLDHQLIELHSLRPTCQKSLTLRESRTGNRAGPQGSQHSLPTHTHMHSHMHTLSHTCLHTCSHTHAHTALHLDLKHVKPCGPVSGGISDSTLRRGREGGFSVTRG